MVIVSLSASSLFLSFSVFPFLFLLFSLSILPSFSLSRLPAFLLLLSYFLLFDILQQPRGLLLVVQ